MSNIALITGASSGIGKEFARYHAAKGGDVVITARRADALAELKAEIESKHGVKAHVFAADLAAPGAAGKLYTAVVAAGLQVDVLINNAGFGGHGIHTERNLADEQNMIDLNISALMTLSHEFGRDMAARGAGKILNVGSTAGFMPGPYQNVYFATKAFVLSFSQALDQELRGKGVTCTVLAPGYVETEFADRANLEGTNLIKNGGKSAASAAKHGYDAMLIGKLVTVNEPMLSVLVNWIVPMLPRRAVLKMVEGMQKK
jgi:short-subunit dehydrogenase